MSIFVETWKRKVRLNAKCSVTQQGQQVRCSASEVQWYNDNYDRSMILFPSTQLSKNFYYSKEFSIFESPFLYKKMTYAPFHYIFNFDARIPRPFFPQHMQHMVTILKSTNKGGLHSVFRCFHIPPYFSAAMKVGGRDEEDLLRYTFSMYFYMQ